MPATQKSRLLAIGTALGDDALLIENLSVTEQLGRLFQIEVKLASEDFAVDFDKIVGTNATIRLELQNGKVRFFNGYISRFLQAGQDGDYARYRATLVPWIWFLTRTSDCRIFQKKKVPDIIEAVFKGHGFKDYKLKLSGDYLEWEYCVQYRETDFNFISRLMEHEGIYYYFTHEDGVHTLVLSDAKSSHEPFPGFDEFVYRTRINQAGDQTAESVTDWVMEKEIQPGVYVHADFNFKKPASPVMGNANINRKHEGAAFEIFDYPGEYDEHAEGDAYAKIRIQELQAQHEILRAQASVRGVCAGCKFTLKDHPRDDQNREYLITGASINVSVGDFESSGEGGGRDFYSCSFTAIPTSENYRAPRLTPKPLIQGPQTAFVVGKSGEEVDPDEFGRVKVQFHWDRYGEVDENSSCFVRVSQSVAGKGWGMISIPRVGQEVIVEFLEGDPDQPIITGRVYNATAKVPYDLPANKTMSAFKSNSSKGGDGFNEIRFEDKKGDEQIYIHGEKNLDIRLKNDRFETIENDRHLVVKKDKFEHVENNRDETVDADHKEKIGKDRHLHVVGKEAKAVDGSLSLTVTGDVIEVFKANHSEDVTGDYFLKAANVVIEATSNVTIKVGSSYIAMEASGIKICGTQIEVEGSATIEAKSPNTTVKGDGMLTLKGGLVKIN